MKIVPHEIFKDYDTDSKLDTLYILQVDVYDKIEVLEKQKRTNTIVAAAGGMVGGFVAVGGAVLGRMAGWFK